MNDVKTPPHSRISIEKMTDTGLSMGISCSFCAELLDSDHLGVLIVIGGTTAMAVHPTCIDSMAAIAHGLS